MRLKGKIALVTALRRESARRSPYRFQREGRDDDLRGPSSQKLSARVARIAADGGSAEALALDVASAESIAAGMKSLLEKHGRIDGARQQRRNHGGQPDSPDEPGLVGSRARDEPDGRLSSLAGRREGDGAEPFRTDRQRDLGRRAHGQRRARRTTRPRKRASWA